MQGVGRHPQIRNHATSAQWHPAAPCSAGQRHGNRGCWWGGAACRPAHKCVGGGIGRRGGGACLLRVGVRRVCVQGMSGEGCGGGRAGSCVLSRVHGIVENAIHRLFHFTIFLFNILIAYGDCVHWCAITSPAFDAMAGMLTPCSCFFTVSPLRAHSHARGTCTHAYVCARTHTPHTLPTPPCCPACCPPGCSRARGFGPAGDCIAAEPLDHLWQPRRGAQGVVLLPSAAWGGAAQVSTAWVGWMP